jgi:RNA polymerase sigma-70 factor (ECF subfamily)
MLLLKKPTLDEVVLIVLSSDRIRGVKRGMKVPETDELLIHKITQGDTGSFGKLVGRYQHQVYNLALRMSGHREDARDITQETFIKAFRALPSFRYEAGFSTWLYRIASNSCLDYLRKRNAESARRIDRPPEAAGDPLERVPAGGPGPEESAISRENREAVIKALASLPDSYRLPLVMHHYQGLSYREISAVLEIPEKTVATRLYRAKNMLKESLTGGDRGEMYTGEKKAGGTSGWGMHAL